MLLSSTARTAVISGLASGSAGAPQKTSLEDLARDAKLGPALTGTQSLRGSLFSSKLEKHIDDVRRGNGNLSSDVAAAISAKAESTSQLLAQSDPKALKNYSGYLTLLGYDKKARFVNSLETTASTLASVPSKEEAQAASDELVKAFYPNSNSGDVKGK
jgi:hypothetical protein